MVLVALGMFTDKSVGDEVKFGLGRSSTAKKSVQRLDIALTFLMGAQERKHDAESPHRECAARKQL
jgi:hypothetical protein